MMKTLPRPFRVLWTASLVVMATHAASAQTIAPSRTLTPQSPMVSRGAPQQPAGYPAGYAPLLRGATKPPTAFGYDALKPVVPVPTQRGAVSGLAEPLSGNEPGSGQMTKFMDERVTDLPGQKHDPINRLKMEVTPQ